MVSKETLANAYQGEGARNHAFLRARFPELSLLEALEFLEMAADDPLDPQMTKEQLETAVEQAANVLLMRSAGPDMEKVEAYLDRNGNNAEKAFREAEKDRLALESRDSFVQELMAFTGASHEDAMRRAATFNYRNLEAAAQSFFEPGAWSQALDQSAARLSNGLADLSITNDGEPSNIHTPALTTQQRVFKHFIHDLDMDSGVDEYDPSLLPLWITATREEQDAQLEYAHAINSLEGFRWIVRTREKIEEMPTRHAEHIATYWKEHGQDEIDTILDAYVRHHDLNAYQDIFEVSEDTAKERLLMSDNFYKASIIATPGRNFSARQKEMIERLHMLRRQWRMRLVRLQRLRKELTLRDEISKFESSG